MLDGGHITPIYHGLRNVGIRVVDLRWSALALLGKPACVNVWIDAQAHAAVSANSRVV